MMRLKNLKKICSFSVSDWHLITMLAPYLSKKLESEEKIYTFFETDMQEIMQKFLSKLTLNSNLKQKLQKLNWNSNKGYKYTQAINLFNDIKNETFMIVVNGSISHIEKVNINIEKWIRKNNIENDITIINCYEVMQFNDNIKKILDLHDKILNTSGEKEIEEVFEGYGKSKQDVG